MNIPEIDLFADGLKRLRLLWYTLTILMITSIYLVPFLSLAPL